MGPLSRRALGVLLALAAAAGATAPAGAEPEQPREGEPPLAPEARADELVAASERKGGSDVEVAPPRTEGIADVSASVAARAAARARTDAPLIIISRTS